MKNPLIVAASICKPTEQDLSFVAEVAGAPTEDHRFLHLRAILAHADLPPNNNGDAFTEDDLKWALSKGIFTPEKPGMLDDEHNQLPFGIWYRSASTEDAGRFAIEIHGVVFAWRFPEFAQEIVERHEKGELRFSMMCDATGGVRCSECGAVAAYVDRDEYCDHLLAPVGLRRASGTVRYLLKPEFYAASRVDNPADKDCRALALASITPESLDPQLVLASGDEEEEKTPEAQKEEALDRLKAHAQEFLETYNEEASVLVEAISTTNEEGGVIVDPKEMEDRIAALEAEKLELEKKIKAYEGEERNREMTALQAEIDDLKAKLAEAQTLQDTIDGQAAKIEELTAQLAEATDARTKAETDLAERVEAEEEKVFEARKATVEALEIEFTEPQMADILAQAKERDEDGWNLYFEMISRLAVASDEDDDDTDDDGDGDRVTASEEAGDIQSAFHEDEDDGDMGKLRSFLHDKKVL